MLTLPVLLSVSGCVYGALWQGLSVHHHQLHDRTVFSLITPLHLEDLIFALSGAQKMERVRTYEAPPIDRLERCGLPEWLREASSRLAQVFRFRYPLRRWIYDGTAQCFSLEFDECKYHTFSYRQLAPLRFEYRHAHFDEEKGKRANILSAILEAADLSMPEPTARIL